MNERGSATYRQQIECARKKKTIKFCQMALNHGEEPDGEALQEFIKEETRELQDYAYQHVNMFAGEPEKVDFVIPERYVSLVIDFFGKHEPFFDKGDGTVTCHIRVSRETLRHWASKFAGIVRVVKPESLVEEIWKAEKNYGLV